MKKIISILLVCLMVLPFSIFASVGVSAAGDVVLYVKDGGTGDGSAANKALPSLQAAYEKVAASGKNTTVVILGEVPFDLTATYGFYPADHAGKLTITGTYGSNVGGKIVISANDNENWVLGGDTEFNNIELAMNPSSPKPNVVFRCHFHDFTFGENVTSPAGTYIVGGIVDAKPANHPDVIATGAALVDKYNYNEDTNTFTGTSNITLKSGTVNEIGVVVRGGATKGAKHDGTINLTISGTTVVNKIAAIRNTGDFITGNINIYLDGGSVPYFICHNHRTAYDAGKTGVAPDAKFTVVVTKNFQLSQSFTTPPASGMFQGIAGSTLAISSGEIVLADESYGDYRLFVEASLWDEMIATNKAFTESFNTVNKIDDGKGLSINEKTATPDKSDIEPPAPPATDDPSTDTESTKVTDKATDKVTTDKVTNKETSKVTDKQTTQTTTTSATDDGAADSEFPWIIVAIAGAVVVAAVVVIIVIVKKKGADNE